MEAVATDRNSSQLITLFVLIEAYHAPFEVEPVGAWVTEIDFWDTEIDQFFVKGFIDFGLSGRSGVVWDDCVDSSTLSSPPSFNRLISSA